MTAPERLARCGCGSTRPSADRDRLAFFESRDDGSEHATETCGNCRYTEAAHEPATRDRPHNRGRICADFTPAGAHEFDAFYCGHRGWD